MTNILSKSLKHLADNVIYAERTLSEYYKIGRIKVRFSDHMANEMDCDLAIFCNTVHKQNVYVIIPMVGTYKQVQWFSNVNDVINFILEFELMARLMLKSPEKAENVAERQKSNMETKITELTNKSEECVSYAIWRQQLQSFYTIKKKSAINDLLENCFTLSKGSKFILDSIKRLSSLTNGEKYIKVLKIVKSL